MKASLCNRGQLILLCFPLMLQDGGRGVLVDKEEIQRVVSSCNDFAEAERRSTCCSDKSMLGSCHICLTFSNGLVVTLRNIMCSFNILTGVLLLWF